MFNTAKQNKFAKVNSTHGKRSSEKKKRKKKTLIIKTNHDVAAKESIKKSRVPSPARGKIENFSPLPEAIRLQELENSVRSQAKKKKRI